MTHTTRQTDWVAALAALVEARRLQPFAWGPNDCAAFAADAYQAMTGVDGLAELRGPRRTRREARQQLWAIGGVAAALLRAGLQPVTPALAQRGDVVLVAQGDWPALAVCVGAEAVAPGPAGLECAPMARAVAAWRV
jgi:cell wall-associated NlpC family hydrolase